MSPDPAVTQHLTPITSNDLAVSLRTGEVFNLTDPKDAANCLREFRELRQHLRDVIAAAEHHLVEHAQTMGTKTLHIEGAGTVTVSGGPGSGIQWDIEILERLRDEGLPEERWNDLVTTEVSYKVNAAVAKSIAGANERYARVIEQAQRRFEKPWRAGVK